MEEASIELVDFEETDKEREEEEEKEVLRE